MSSTGSSAGHRSLDRLERAQHVPALDRVGTQVVGARAAPRAARRRRQRRPRAAASTSPLAPAAARRGAVDLLPARAARRSRGSLTPRPQVGASLGDQRLVVHCREAARAERRAARRDARARRERLAVVVHDASARRGPSCAPRRMGHRALAAHRVLELLEVATLRKVRRALGQVAERTPCRSRTPAAGLRSRAGRSRCRPTSAPRGTRARSRRSRAATGRAPPSRATLRGRTTSRAATVPLADLRDAGRSRDLPPSPNVLTTGGRTSIPCGISAAGRARRPRGGRRGGRGSCHGKRAADRPCRGR